MLTVIGPDSTAVSQTNNSAVMHPLQPGIKLPRAIETEASVVRTGRPEYACEATSEASDQIAVKSVVNSEMPTCEPTFLAKAPANPLLMPLNAMYGALTEVAQSLQAPLGWAYCLLLTLVSGLGVCLSDLVSSVRPTLYTALVGGAGDGKSRTMSRARMSVRQHRDYLKTTTPGSDRGLFKMFARQKDASAPHRPESYVLAQDEMKNLLAKINIQGSSLAPTLCSLFYEDEAGSADKTGDHTIRIRLSILGTLKASDPEEFAECFGNETTAGLYDRHILVPAERNWEFDDGWKPTVYTYAPNVAVSIPSVAFQRLREWRKAASEGTSRGRLGEIALRVAVISAAANNDVEVGPDCMEAALRFAEWQERVRKFYSPSVAKSPDAAVTGFILDEFIKHEKDRPGEWVRFWDIARQKNWGRKYGSATVTRAKKALIEDGFLTEETATDERGNERRLAHARLRLCVS